MNSRDQLRALAHRYRLALIASLSTLSAGCLVDSEGRIGSEADSRPDLPDAAPIVNGVSASKYPEAVLIDAVRWGKPWRCTGAVIAPRVVLTAGHCVVGVSSSTIVAPFAAGQKSNGIAHLSYDWKDTSGYIVPDQHDVAVIVLDSPIVLQSYPVVADAKVVDGTLALNVGRIKDGDASAKSLFLSPAQPVRDGAPSGWAYNYLSDEVIQSGDSGGPVVLEGGPQHTIIAVNSASGSGTQFLARVDLLSEWIAERVAAASSPSAEGAESSAPSNSCGHSFCDKGAALTGSCDPCVASICEADAYCCSTSWDHLCVKAVSSVCKLGC